MPPDQQQITVIRDRPREISDPRDLRVQVLDLDRVDAGPSRWAAELGAR